MTLHYDGKSWTTMSELIGVTAIWLSASDDVYLSSGLRIFQYGP